MAFWNHNLTEFTHEDQIFDVVGKINKALYEAELGAQFVIADEEDQLSEETITYSLEAREDLVKDGII